MPSSKKKQKGKAKARGGASSSAGNSTKPRSNDEIIGEKVINRLRPPKKALVKEIYDSLLYEVNSDARAEIVAKVAALENEGSDKSVFKKEGLDNVADLQRAIREVVAEKEGHSLADIPITYETPEMVNYTKGAMLTVGPVAPFRLAKARHPRAKNLGRLKDEERKKQGMRWTGKEDAIHVCFPQLHSLGRESIVFLGECQLCKEDLAYFAARFRKGASTSSPFNWPVSNAVLQCPFTCKMAVPEKEKTATPKRYIMVLQNIKQLSVAGRGVMGIIMPHRGLPRLCDKSYFEKNLQGGLEFVTKESEASKGLAHFGSELPDDTEWCQFPQILEEGIAFRAAHKVLPSRTRALATSSAAYVPSAYTLFMLYQECGMLSAVSEVIDNDTRRLAEQLGVGLSMQM